MNNVICSRHPHVFVISETKTALFMGLRLPAQDYNVYEEVGVHCTNHHTVNLLIMHKLIIHISHSA
jgi:hypothetical protein